MSPGSLKAAHRRALLPRREPARPSSVTSRRRGSRPGGEGSLGLARRRPRGDRVARARPASRAAAARGPSGRRAVQHPPGRPGPAAYRPDVPRGADRQRHLRRVLLLPADHEHPGGQGLHLQPVQQHPDPARRRTGGHLRRCRDRGHGAGAGRDALRARQDRDPPCEARRGRGRVQYLTATSPSPPPPRPGFAETLTELLSATGWPVDRLLHSSARLAAVTLEDVQAAAAAMLAPAAMVSVVVGDADVVEAGLALLTEVVRH